MSNKTNPETGSILWKIRAADPISPGCRSRAVWSMGRSLHGMFVRLGCGAAGTAPGDLSMFWVLVQEQLLLLSGSWLRGRWDLSCFCPRGCSADSVGFLIGGGFII